MANEITILESDGLGTFAALFLYPIAAPKTYSTPTGTKTVVWTPSAGLPATAKAVLSSAEQASLDAGTSAYELIPFLRDPALTDAQNTANIKARYADQKADATARYTDTYRYVGVRITAP